MLTYFLEFLNKRLIFINWFGKVILCIFMIMTVRELKFQGDWLKRPECSKDAGLREFNSGS